MTKDVYKVGIIKFTNHASLNRIEAGLKRCLDELSKRTGKKFDCDGLIYDGKADPKEMKKAAQALAQKKVDLVLSIATPTTVAVKPILEEHHIPIVFQAVSDPITANVIESFEHPGQYITGTSDGLDGGLLAKMLLAVHPETKIVGLLYGKNEISSKRPIEELKAALTERGVAFSEISVDNKSQVMGAAESLVEQKVEAVLTPTDNTVMSAELLISPIFTDAGIPQFTGSHAFVINGAFFGLGGSYRSNEGPTMQMIEDILINGKSPMDIPVVRGTHSLATVNNQICERLGYDKGKLTQIFAGQGLETVFLDSQAEFAPDSE